MRILKPASSTTSQLSLVSGWSKYLWKASIWMWWHWPYGQYTRLLAQLMLPFPLSRGEVLSTHSSLAFIILLRWWISVLLSHVLNETYIAAEISRNKLDQVQEEYIPKALCRVCSNRQTSQRLCAITASSVFLIPPCHVHMVEELWEAMQAMLKMDKKASTCATHFTSTWPIEGGGGGGMVWSMRTENLVYQSAP